MAIKITQTCDECQTEIASYHLSRCLAFTGPDYVTFKPWDEKDASKVSALHFHNDNCSRAYLGSWLLHIRVEAQKRVPAAPAPVQELDKPLPDDGYPF